MISIGNNEVSNLYVGNTPVQSVYVGNTQVWSNAQWHTIYDGDGLWFYGKGTGNNSTSYSYKSVDIDRNNTLSGLDFKPNAKYRIWITKLNREVKAGTTLAIHYGTADTIDPMYIECDDNFEIRLNSTFSGSNAPDHNRVYTLFHVVDGKLVCTVYYATKETFFNTTYYPSMYYVSIKVTKIEQYY